jgi:hypothetical protein
MPPRSRQLGCVGKPVRPRLAGDADQVGRAGHSQPPLVPPDPQGPRRATTSALQTRHAVTLKLIHAARGLAHSGQSVRILGADTAVNRPPAVAIPTAASKPRSSTNSNTPLCCGSSPNRPPRVHYPGVRPALRSDLTDLPHGAGPRPVSARGPSPYTARTESSPSNSTRSGSLNQWPLLPRYRNRVRVPSGNATDADRVPLDRRRNWCIPGCHPLKSPTTLHPAAGSSASNTNVTLTLLALREILITLVSLTEASNSSVPDNLGPHTATRRCCGGEPDRAT